MKTTFSTLVSVLTVPFRSRLAMQMEILALRHQLSVYGRSRRRPRIRPADRILWAWLSRICAQNTVLLYQVLNPGQQTLVNLAGNVRQHPFPGHPSSPFGSCMCRDRIRGMGEFSRKFGRISFLTSRGRSCSQNLSVRPRRPYPCPSASIRGSFLPLPRLEYCADYGFMNRSG